MSIKKYITEKNALIFLVIFLIFGLLTNGVPFIYSDGYGSFHTTNCLVTEQSWACKNKPEYFPDYSAHGVSYYEGKYVTVYAPGSAIINLPFQIIANLLDSSGDIDNLFIATNGHTVYEGIGFLLTASILIFFSLVLQYKSLRSLNFSERISIISVLISFISSYMVWYVLLNSAFNHNVEVFGISLFIWAFIQAIKTNNLKYFLLIGLSIGLSVISRPTLGVIIIPVICLLLYLKHYRGIVGMIAGGLPFAILLFSYNYVSYGSVFASSYSILFDQHFDFSSWNGVDILFSKYRGFFLYSPLFIISSFFIIKSFVSKNSDKIKNHINIIGLFCFASTVFIYGFWPMWWGGASFGQRFLLPVYPFLILGGAMFLEYILNINEQHKKYIYILIVTLLVFWSSLITLFYRFTPVGELRIDEDIESHIIAPQDRYTIPDIFKYQYSIINESGSIFNYVNNLINSASGGMNLPVFLLKKDKPVIRLENDDNRIYIKYFKASKSNLTKLDFFFEYNQVYYKANMEIGNEVISENSITCNKSACSSGEVELIKGNIEDTANLEKIVQLGNYKIYFPSNLELFIKGGILIK